MIRNLIFDVGDVLVEYRWFEMLTRDYGLSEAEAKRIGEEMFDNEIWVQGLDGGRLSLEEAIHQYELKYPDDVDVMGWFLRNGEQMAVKRPEVWDKVAALKDLTGAIASVDGTALTARKTSQISNALQGALPGVTVTRTNSAPGANATIRIRGITSMKDSSPLVIIDGAPGAIGDVNPADVENISVLKDAASAAIYGARAAAGVILITTKRAKSGEPTSVDYTYSISLDYPTRMPDGVSLYICSFWAFM